MFWYKTVQGGIPAAAILKFAPPRGLNGKEFPRLDISALVGHGELIELLVTRIVEMR